MPAPRIDAIDALRGLALVWMTLFHFCFDLNHFGYLQQDFHHDTFWTTQRTMILGTFLFCAGLGQAAAHHQSQSWARFWRRWCQVAGCAVLVTGGSWLMYPNSFIYFGVLHGMALMLLVARLSAAWGNWLWLLGGLAIAAKPIAALWLAGSAWATVFNAPWLNWLGLITQKPVTEDYVPLIPWLGVLWWGLAAGCWLLQHPTQQWLRWQPSAAGRSLALLGRWSLSYYMLHQPVLIGAIFLWGAVRRGA